MQHGENVVPSVANKKPYFADCTFQSETGATFFFTGSEKAKPTDVGCTVWQHHNEPQRDYCRPTSWVLSHSPLEVVTIHVQTIHVVAVRQRLYLWRCKVVWTGTDNHIQSN